MALIMEKKKGKMAKPTTLFCKLKIRSSILNIYQGKAWLNDFWRDQLQRELCVSHTGMQWLLYVHAIM